MSTTEILQEEGILNIEDWRAERLVRTAVPDIAVPGIVRRPEHPAIQKVQLRTQARDAGILR